MKYRVVLTTVASITVTVSADDEDSAFDLAHNAAQEFANRPHCGSTWSVDINDAWDLRESTITELDD